MLRIPNWLHIRPAKRPDEVERVARVVEYQSPREDEAQPRPWLQGLLLGIFGGIGYAILEGILYVGAVALMLWWSLS